MYAHGGRWQDGELKIKHVILHDADFILRRDPCGQVHYLIILRSCIEFEEWDLDGLGFCTVLDNRDSGGVAPFDDGEIGIELPHDGVGDVAVFVLDVADGHGELVAVHSCKHVIAEGEVDITVGDGEVEIRVIQTHEARTRQQRRCAGSLAQQFAIHHPEIVEL